MSVFSKEWLENNTLPITDFQQLNITKSLEVLLILVIILIVNVKLFNTKEEEEGLFIEVEE